MQRRHVSLATVLGVLLILVLGAYARYRYVREQTRIALALERAVGELPNHTKAIADMAGKQPKLEWKATLHEGVTTLTVTISNSSAFTFKQIALDGIVLDGVRPNEAAQSPAWKIGELLPKASATAVYHFVGLDWGRHLVRNEINPVLRLPLDFNFRWVFQPVAAKTTGTAIKVSVRVRPAPTAAKHTGVPVELDKADAAELVRKIVEAKRREEQDLVPDDFKIVAHYYPGLGSFDSWDTTITGDGRVSQKITQFLKGGISRRILSLSHDDVRDLLEKVKAADFFGIPKEFSFKATDNPTLVLNVTMNKKTHEVSVYAPGHLGNEPGVKRFLKVWCEVLKKVPSPNPKQTPEQPYIPPDAEMIGGMEAGGVSREVS